MALSVLQFRRDVEANWNVNNPILASGEPGLLMEPDPNNTSLLKPGGLKLGDGSTRWNDLAYFSTGGSGGGSVVTTRAQQSGTTINYTVNSQPAQQQYRNLSGSNVVITDIVGIPLNSSVQVDVNGIGNAFTYTISVPTKAIVVGAFNPGERNIVTIVCVNAEVGNEFYWVVWTNPRKTAYNKDFADDTENIDDTATDVVMDPRGVHLMITDKVALTAEAQNPSNNTTLMTPARVFDTLATKQAFTALSDAATITWTFGFAAASHGDKVEFTLGASRTLAISGMPDGATGLMKITQDGTGSRALALPANSFCADGNNSLPLSSAPNAVDFVSVTRVGTNYYFHPVSVNYTAAS